MNSLGKLPLLGTAGPDSLLFRRADAALTRGEFAARAAALAESLPGDGPLLNLCEQREAFALTLAAGLLSGRPCLMPPSATPVLIRQIAEVHGAGLAVSEREDACAGLRWQAPVVAVAGTHRGPMPQIADTQIAAIPFTSGSTGMPQPHPKSWGTLLRTAQLANARFLGDASAASIVATVPPQHMYGLETTVMLALAGDASSWSGRPFFPADVVAALAAVPPPRLLITTPVHLRACVAAGLRMPAVARIVSATAPLPRELAAQAEALFAAPVHEIYGCTEAGSMASRRTTDTELWQPYPGARMVPGDDGTCFSGEHLPEPVLLQDQVELAANDAFRLLGRTADLLKVAGKRMSAADLTQRLLSIPGVLDCVVLPPEPGAVVERPAALVVAPQLGESEILAALARLIDPVFLPRPLKRVAELPRNAVGKLPRAQLLELLHD